MSQGIHPQHILHSEHKAATLKKDFVTALSQIYKTQRNVWYRPLHLDSEALRGLSYADSFEPIEANPYLGFRGALKAINMPEIFKFELHVLSDFSKTVRTPINICLPMARSPREVKQLLSVITKEAETDKVLSWLPMSTPAQVFDFEAYLLPELTGYILDVDMVRSLLFGYDPDNLEVAGQYNTANTLFEKMLAPLVSSVLANNKHIYLYMNTFSSNLLDVALQANVTGVIIKPKNALYARESIFDYEKKLLI